MTKNSKVHEDKTDRGLTQRTKAGGTNLGNTGSVGNGKNKSKIAAL